ncbi:MAG TPA: hypothetical protein VFA11_10330 [Acidimicrobiales bacterium]|nr:hypothetical protein [Acidimicrobiales bacterium]
MERLTSSSDAAPQPDWPAKAADTIDAVVTTVRDRTVGPLTTVAKALVYGIVVGIVGTAVAILGAVGAVRVSNIYAMPDWASELTVGGIFSLGGLFLLSRAWKARRAARRG